MPDYVYNRVVMKNITSLDIFSIDGEDEQFDFNKIFPMPESLNLTDGSCMKHDILYYLSEKLTIPYDSIPQESLDIVQRSGRIHFDLKKDFMDLKAKTKEYTELYKNEMYTYGKNYIDNLKNYGCLTWYDWCQKHWGTKWNAFDTKIIDKDTVEFITAWNPPVPIFSKLSELFWDEPIYVTGDIEGHGKFDYEFKNGIGLANVDGEKYFIPI